MGVGGDMTVRSFGLEPYSRSDDARDYIRRLRSVVPREWVSWLKRLPLFARSGDYFFCHAGVRPGVPLRRQVRNDLLWIREDFLDDDADHGAIIVHGHSIEPEVAIRANRIGIDTGAYRTGVLTALYLDGDKRDIISTKA
jgi:serine/threonine protein phosphatase 1